MLCAEILDGQCYINIALIITAIHFTFTVRYVKLLYSVLIIKLFGKCNTQNTENTHVNKHRRLADGNVHCAGSATYQICFRLPQKFLFRLWTATASCVLLTQYFRFYFHHHHHHIYLLKIVQHNFN